MPSTTAINGIPYPLTGEAPDVVAEIAAFSAAVDSKTVPRFANASARNAAITSPVAGQLAYLINEAMMTEYDGTSWLVGVASEVVRKENTQSTTSTTAISDNELKVLLQENATYHIDVYLSAGSTSTTHGLIVQWGIPSGATLMRMYSGQQVSATPNSNNHNSRMDWITTAGQLQVTCSPTAGLNTPWEEFMVVTTGSTAGYMTLFWNQNSAGTAGATGRIRSDSYIVARRIA